MLDAHLEVNPKSWAALQERGVDEDTALQLDFEFTAVDEAETRSLMRYLGTTTDYEYKGGARNQAGRHAAADGLGTTSPMTLSLDELNEWVTRMTARRPRPRARPGSTAGGAARPDAVAAAVKILIGIFDLPELVKIDPQKPD